MGLIQVKAWNQQRTFQQTKDLPSNTGVYAFRSVRNLHALKVIAKFLGCTIDNEYLYEAHCTVVFSPEPVRTNVVADIESLDDVKILGLTWWPGHNNKGYVVMLVDHPYLHERHKMFVRAGARPTFKDYTPHITLAKGIPQGGVNIAESVRLLETLEDAGAATLRLSGEYICRIEE